MSSFEAFVSWRYLRGKRKVGTYVTAVGICLGSFVLIIALSIANGFEKEVRDRIVGTHAHARIMQYHSRPIENHDSLRQVILKYPGVTGAAPYISGKAAVEHDQVQEGVMFTAVDDKLEASVTDLGTTVKWGTFNLDSAESDRGRRFPGICIGLGLADKLGVRDGAEVVVMTLANVEGEADPVPRMSRFTVTGVFETGMYEYDLGLIYISIGSAQQLMNRKVWRGFRSRQRTFSKLQKFLQICGIIWADIPTGLLTG